MYHMYQFSDCFWSFGSLPLKTKTTRSFFVWFVEVDRNGINKPTKNAACAKHDHRPRSLPKAHSAWRVCQGKDVDCSIGLQHTSKQCIRSPNQDIDESTSYDIYIYNGSKGMCMSPT